MDNSQLEFTEKLIQSELNIEQKENFKNFEKLFKFYNSHTNLISKNDEKFLFEKHIYDSLALSLFIKKYKSSNEILYAINKGFENIQYYIDRTIKNYLTASQNFEDLKFNYFKLEENLHKNRLDFIINKFTINFNVFFYENKIVFNFLYRWRIKK